jgi:hypothetical protein
LPTVPTSAAFPLRVTDMTEHTPLSGKQTCVMGWSALERLSLNVSGFSVR